MIKLVLFEGAPQVAPQDDLERKFTVTFRVEPAEGPRVAVDSFATTSDAHFPGRSEVSLVFSIEISMEKIEEIRHLLEDRFNTSRDPAWLAEVLVESTRDFHEHGYPLVAMKAYVPD